MTTPYIAGTGEWGFSPLPFEDKTVLHDDPCHACGQNDGLRDYTVMDGLAFMLHVDWRRCVTRWDVFDQDGAQCSG